MKLQIETPAHLVDVNGLGGGQRDAPPPGRALAWRRPGRSAQRAAGRARLRYGVPAYLPATLLRHVPVLPVDRDLAVPLVHSTDVADAVALVLRDRATGPFNLAAEPAVTRDLIAEVLGAHPVHVPRAVLRAAANVTWRARLQPLDPGWIDLAFSVPLLDTSRARTVLGWSPTVDARIALSEVVTGMSDASGTSSPALRPRSVPAELAALVLHGQVVRRPYP